MTEERKKFQNERERGHKQNPKDTAKAVLRGIQNNTGYYQEIWKNSNK